MTYYELIDIYLAATIAVCMIGFLWMAWVEDKRNEWLPKKEALKKESTKNSYKKTVFKKVIYNIESEIAKANGSSG